MKLVGSIRLVGSSSESEVEFLKVMKILLQKITLRHVMKLLKSMTRNFISTLSA